MALGQVGGNVIMLRFYIDAQHFFIPPQFCSKLPKLKFTLGEKKCVFNEGGSV
jgi:hypothetical protein